MRSLLLVWVLAWIVLVPAPVLSQPSSGGPSSQYAGPDSGVGGRAAHDAIVASGAIRATSQEAQASDENAASAAELAGAPTERDAVFAQQDDAALAEARSESTPEPEKLPDTGGPSPSWLGLPLLCIGTLLARRVLY